MAGPASIRVFNAVVVAAWLAAPASGQVPAPEVSGGAEPLRVTREQAIAWALGHNPGLVAVREQVEQARAQVVVAGAFPDPTFSADLTGQSRPFSPASA